jgi:LemA protein
MDAGTKYMQSSRITRIGCFGLVLVLVLLILIGAVGVRAEINKKRSVVIGAYNRMVEQAEKAPGVLNRMLSFNCGDDAEVSVSEAENSVARLSELDAPSISVLEETWDEIETAWVEVNRGCSMSLSEDAFRDLTIEMEGLRNRFSVEKGNFEEAAEIYNSALRTFPANIFAYGSSEL